MNIFQKIMKAGEDKVIHFLVCLILADYSVRIIYAIIPDRAWVSYVFAFFIGWMIAYGAGMWKEEFDKTHGGSCDQKDLTADALGAFAGAALAIGCLLIGL